MVSQTVAEFVASADPESLPPEVSHAVKRSLLNFFATALEGTHDIAVEPALWDHARAVVDAGAHVVVARHLVHTANYWRQVAQLEI